MAKQKPTHYAISADADGFRRAGRAWRIAPTAVAAGELTDEALAMLEADPSITVRPIGGEEAERLEQAQAISADPRFHEDVRLLALAFALAGLDAVPEPASLEERTGLPDIGFEERDRVLRLLGQMPPIKPAEGEGGGWLPGVLDKILGAKKGAEVPADEGVVAAIDGLDKGIKDAWTKAGTPKKEWIEGALGRAITVEARDQAWAFIQARDQQGGGGA